MISEESEYPLHEAVENEDIEKVRQLIQAGFNVNARNNWRATPMHIAARNNVLEAAQLLLDSGADICALDDSDTSPLNDAAWFGRVEMTRWLLTHGAAKENALDLQRAVRAATIDDGYCVIPILQEFGATIGLAESIYLEDEQTVLKFLNDGADINQIDDGDPLLIHAVWATRESYCQNFVPLLVERGANINARSIQDGYTALMVAAKWEKTGIVRYLLDHGADPAIKSNDNDTALSLTPEYALEIIEMLSGSSAP